MRHLLAARTDEADVHPVLHKRLPPRKRFALGDLVLVMGEDEVLAAAVDVDLVAESVADHGGALDVPAGPALPPWAFPERLLRLRALPECEVAGVALAWLQLLAD